MSEAAAAESFTIRRWTDADRLDELLALVHGAFGALVIDPPSSALKERSVTWRRARARRPC